MQKSFSSWWLCWRGCQKATEKRSPSIYFWFSKAPSETRSNVKEHQRKVGICVIASQFYVSVSFYLKLYLLITFIVIYVGTMGGIRMFLQQVTNFWPEGWKSHKGHKHPIPIARSAYLLFSALNIYIGIKYFLVKFRYSK